MTSLDFGEQLAALEVVQLPDPLVWIPLAFGPGVATYHLVSGRVLLGGWALANPGGAAGDMARIFDVNGAGGQRFASIGCGPNGDMSMPAIPPGVYAPNGLTIVTSAANIEGVVFYADLS